MRYISCNGKITAEGSVSVDEGYLYGYGLFETLKVQDSKMFFFKEHVDRLCNGSVRLGLEYQLEDSQVFDYCEELIFQNKMNHGALRITYSKSRHMNQLIITSRENPYTDETISRGFNIITSSSKRNETSMLVNIKSNNYLENLLISKQIKVQGYNEAFFYNTKGFLAEGTMSNVFFVKNNAVFTPAINNGLLSGIIRGKIIKLTKALEIPLEEGYYKMNDVINADEIFITNSLMEIMPVRLLDSKGFTMNKDSLTNYLIKEYRKCNY